MTASTLDGTGDVVDVHAHHVPVGGFAEIGRVAHGLAPAVRARDGGWAIEMPPGLLKAHPNGTSIAVPKGLIDLETRFAEMDAQGVQYHALRNYTPLNFAHLPAEQAAELHRIQNDAVVAEVRAAPDRLVALPALPLPHAELAAAEVRRLAAFREVVGLGIGTNVGGMDLDDERLEPLWAAVNEVGLPVLIHPPGIVAGADRMGGYHLANLIGNPVDSTVAIGRLIFSGLLDRYPNVRIGLVHGGGYTPYQIGRWDHGWRVRDEARARISRPPSEYLRSRCWFDSLTHDARALSFLGEQVGWDRVLLGSDYPWDMATSDPVGDLDAVGLAPSDRRLVTTQNALSFLRWPTQAT